MAKLSDSTNIDWVQIQEQGSDPATPSTGYGRVYAKTDGLYYVDDAGTVTGPLSTGGGLASGAQQRDVLHDETLASPGRFDVSSISQSYDHLELILTARSSTANAGDSVYMFFNNDTTVTNYHRQRSGDYDNTTSQAGEAADAIIASITGGGSPTSAFGLAEIFIPNYTSTSMLKVARVQYQAMLATAAIVTAHIGFMWEDGGATAINRITIQPDGYATDNFAANSRLQIIGIKTAT